MDNYFLSKIALSLLLSGVLGFFIGCWWAWSVFSSWRKRTVSSHATALSEIEAQLEELNKKSSDEKARAMEAKADAEAAEAKARATEARLRSLEETSRIQMQASDKDLVAVRDMLDSVQPKLRLLEEKESELQTWIARFDGLAKDKDDFIAGIRSELEAAVVERDGLKTRLDEVVTEKDRTIAELMERLAGVSDAARELEEARLKQKNLEDQAADYRQTIDTWETHVNSITREQSALLEAANASAASLRTEVEALRTNLSERNEDISRLEADAALLSHLRQSMRERQTRIDGLKLQLEQSRNALQKTLNELVQLKKFAESSRDAQAKVRDAEIELLRGELEGLRANLSERNEALGRLEADAALLSHVRQSMRERQTRIDGLNLQLANARKEIDQLKKGPAVAPNGDPGSAVEEMAEKLAEQERQIQLLEENLIAASSTAATVVAPVDSVPREEFAALQAEVSHLRTELLDREERLSSLDELSASIAERDRQIQLLEQNLMEAGQASQAEAANREASLEAELAGLRVEAAGKETALQQEISRLRADLTDRDERLSAWENRYEAALGELHEEAGRLQERIRHMEAGRGTLPHKPAAAAAASPAYAPLEVPAEPASVPAPAPAPVMPSVDVQARLRLATMRGIQFRPDSDEIEPSSIAILDSALEAMQGLSPATEIEIAGHTDSWGDDAANQHLSERRALAVRTYLVSRGATSHLVAKGFGGSRPIADNLTADGRYANRRIEFVVKG